MSFRGTLHRRGSAQGVVSIQTVGWKPLPNPQALSFRKVLHGYLLKVTCNKDPNVAVDPKC